MTVADDVRLAGELVRDAGRLALEMRRGGIAAEQKSSVSDLVTAADLAAEEAIVERLAREHPDDGVQGEEGASRRSRTGRRWVIDPVDGTYNFVAGLSWWCSALALVDGDDLLLGAVYHPHDDVVYVGGPDVPTTRNDDPLPVVADRSLGESCLATYLHPPFYGGAVGAAFGRVAGRAATLRMLGSGSMDHTAVAQGQLHVWCQHSVPPWDALPGRALVLGAGGAARTVSAAGVEWSLAGAPTAVAEAADALGGDGDDSAGGLGARS